MSVRRRTLVDIASNPDPESLNLSALIQLVHDSQTRAIVAALKHISRQFGTSSDTSLLHILKSLDAALNTEGLDGIVPRDRVDGFLARPRAFEIGMAINRLVRIPLRWSVLLAGTESAAWRCSVLRLFSIAYSYDLNGQTRP